MEPAPTNPQSSRAPRPEHLVEAVRCLLEGLPVGDRYLVALRELIERESSRRRRTPRRVA